MRNPGPVTQKSDHVTRHLLLCVAVNLDVVCTLVTMAGSTMTWTLSVLLCLGLCWGPWDQVQAEFGPKLSIWADPGPIVSKGNPVTIWCQGSLQVDGYILFKEKSSEPLNTTITQASSHKTGFLIQSMSSYDTGLYQCAYSTGGRLSERSEPLLLVLTGEHSGPSLSAQPGPVVTSGGNVSLLCSSQSTWDTFHLLKEGGAELLQHKKSEHRSYERRWQAVFPVGPVSSSHGGTYRCYGSSSSNPNVWSQPSAPLHLEVTGKDSKPSLSVQPGPSVPWGANVTLQCRSEDRADTFHLHREGSLDPPQQLHLQDTAAPSQANFTISPVTWGHRGTYRCYSSRSSSPFQLSQPSDPLELLVSDYTVGNLIRLGVSGFILVVLGVLLCEAWHSWRRPHDAARS
ncbi:leukocyte immunoglobulin-like receptor subfamily A member 2 isoform X1 [Artibeus jamaicensis]|uniref:leukocyte immunoglobulin-like receptor subfamily A member 2 isoform X1 n=1 Tax=Artibeus jamaicensis TaxID=9417 RepID=UPI00235A4811|nr:leukocyte immunoglobulin-like receptor subfamily A member 2 isoform X1 [Artibeus jamaicensis]